MKRPVEEKRYIILQILREARGPLPSHKIMAKLQARGIDMSERTVRFHLHELDQRGHTSYQEKKGRIITERGERELNRSQVYKKIGFLSARIDNMTYKMDFDWRKRSGTVLVNISLIKKLDADKIADLMVPFYESKMTMGTKLALFGEGERVGETDIPTGYIGIGTVCSITFNGILLSEGIPVVSAFGGLLEVQKDQPERFVAIIKYSGTSLDPLEIYIKGRMTDCVGVADTGTGLIGASFREVPAGSREEVFKIDQDLKKIGLSGVLKIGYPGDDLLGIPVPEGRCGLIIAGGLNAVSVLEESNIDLISHALSGMIPFDRLFHYDEIAERVKKLL